MIVKNNHTEILQADASLIAEKIKNKSITCEECVTISIKRLREVSRTLNAVVETRFDVALQEAKEKDKLIRGNKVIFQDQPLFGVPVSIKESIDVESMKTTGGLHYRSDLMMTENASSVNKLQEAGAIILCKTNTPSLCFCHETDNKLYGRTNNAWNKKMTAGGSSGGEAALISTGASPLGLASDIGGSIRLPSHFNGVIGFKPGKFQVDTSGHFPPDQIPLKNRMSSIGPIGKSVRDVQLAYHLIAQPAERKALYEKMQIHMLPSDNGFPLSKETTTLLNALKRKLEKTHQIRLTTPPYFNDSAQIWQELMSIDGGKEIKQLTYNTDRPNVWRSYLREKLTNKTTIHQYLSWALIDSGIFKPSKKRQLEIKDFIKEGDYVLNNYLQNRLLIFPVYHTFAQPHGQVYKEIFSVNKTYEKYMPYLAYANVWGLPSLTVPLSLGNEHLPIGIQSIGKVGNEESIFNLGQQIEQQFGGYIRSTHYDKTKA